MEALGAAASIVGLIQVSGEITSLGYDYIGRVWRARGDIKELMDEVVLFSRVLQAVKEVTDRFKLEELEKQQVQLKVLKVLDGSLEGWAQELENLELELRRCIGKKHFREKLGILMWPLKEAGNKELLERVRRQKELLDTALVADNISLSKITNQGVKDNRTKLDTESAAQESWRQSDEKRQIMEKRKEVLHWLDPGDYDTEHLRISSSRQKGTGKWLLESPEFQRLVKERSDLTSQLLWGYGIPGAGKTFLSSLVIDHFEEQARANLNHGVAYVYFDYMKRERQKSVHVLASLIKQLAGNLINLPTDLVKLQDELVRKNKRPTAQELYPCLLSTFKSFDRVFLVFDALDECNQDTQRRDLLNLFHQMKNDGASLFVTSRQYPEDIRLSFSTVSRVELAAQEGDIKSYIGGKIGEGSRARRLARQGKCEDRIISEVVDCARGMFLLVRFHIEYICQQTTAREVITALETLRTSSEKNRPLDDTYDRVTNVILEQSESSINLAKLVLSWLVKAKRTLTVGEIQTAVSIKYKRYELDDLDLPDRETLLDVCGGLVTIDENSDTIRLAHFTVQEYILRRVIIPEDADFRLFAACLTYLSFDVFADAFQSNNKGIADKPDLMSPSPDSTGLWGDRVKSWLELHPFLEYAARYMTHHLKDFGEDLSMNLVLEFLKRPRSFCSWCIVSRGIQKYHLSESGYEKYIGPQIPLLMASAIGNSLVVQQLLEGGADVSVKHEHDGSTCIGWAAIEGHEGVVRLLIKSGASVPEARDFDGQAVLCTVAQKGYESTARLLIENGADIEAQDGDGDTALILAAWNGHEPLVRLLLEKGAGIEVQDSDGDTALILAASSGHEAIVRLLLEEGASLEAQNTSGNTALILAADKGYESVVPLLLEKGASLEAQNTGGNTALILAAGKGYESVVRLLFGKGASLEVQNTNGNTALILAADKGYESVVRLLLEKGASLEVQNANGNTALILAAWNGHEPVVRLLLENGADIETQDSDGDTALTLAAWNGHEPLVRLLLEKGAGIEAQDSDGDTALILAASYGYEAIVRLLLEKGAGVEVQNTSGNTALILAAGKGYESVARLLLEKGASLESQNTSGDTALIFAADKGYESVVPLLLEKGASLEAQNTSGDTALILAADKGYESVVRLLLGKGASLEVQNTNGNTALILAAWNGHEPVVRLLLENGAGIETQDSDGDTALTLAAWNGHEPVVRLLLEKGAGIEVQDSDGDTALILAAWNGHEPVVRLLLDKGAGVDVQNSKGNTALILATHNGHKEIIQLLEEALNIVPQCG